MGFNRISAVVAAVVLCSASAAYAGNQAPNLVFDGDCGASPFVDIGLGGGVVVIAVCDDPDATYPCNFDWEFRDGDSVVVDSGTMEAANMGVNEFHFDTGLLSETGLYAFRITARDNGNAVSAERVCAISVLPQRDCWLDLDEDTWGDPSTLVTLNGPEAVAGCAAHMDGSNPAGSYVDRAGDCDDSDETESPDVRWYPDVDGDTFGDSLATGSACERANADDVTDRTDCDDNDADEFPGVEWHLDQDGDGFGDPNIASTCERSAPSDVQSSNDCDDLDADEKPGALWYPDADGDGFGDPSATANACERAVDTDVLDNTDCDDSDADEFPGVEWHLDQDGDSFGDPNVESICERSNDSDVANSSDCDDLDADEKPGALWYPDGDGDGFGDPSATANACERAADSDVLDNTDCNDSNADDVFPAHCGFPMWTVTATAMRMRPVAIASRRIRETSATTVTATTTRRSAVRTAVPIKVPNTATVSTTTAAAPLRATTAFLCVETMLLRPASPVTTAAQTPTTLSLTSQFVAAIAATAAAETRSSMRARAVMTATMSTTTRARTPVPTVTRIWTAYLLLQTTALP